MLSRTEFANYFNSLDPRLGHDDSPLWIPDENIPSNYFVCVKPLNVSDDKINYYNLQTDIILASIMDQDKHKIINLLASPLDNLNILKISS